MKKTTIKILATALLLLALGGTSAVGGTTPAPICYPNPCSAQPAQ
jgi:hypothetical protein